MRVGSERVTKREWYALGGLANSKLWRRADRKGIWRYYIRHSR